MNRSLIIASAIVALGLSLLGLFVKWGIDNFSYRDRIVTVRGLAERTVEADFVTWPMSYGVAGNDLPALYDRMQNLNQKVVSFLTTNGIEDKDISVNPPSLYNSESNYYSGDRAKYQYNLSITITVSTSKVAKVRELQSRLSELLKEGVAINTNYVSYEFTHLNDIKPEMIAEATKNARLAADQFANDSQSKLGKIKTASQGQFSIDDTDANTPQTKKVRVVSSVVFYLED